MLPLEQVVEPARRCDQDVRAACELRLGADGGAAVDRRDAEVLRGGERPQVGCDLGGELARRDENECRRARALRLSPLDERNAECEGLARAGRRLGENVEAAERVREDVLLHRERAMDVLSASARTTDVLTPSAWKDCDN